MNTKTSSKSSVQKTQKQAETARGSEQKNLTFHRTVTVKTAALMLSCCEKSIYRLIKRGVLVPIRLLRTLRFPEKQIEDLMKIKEIKLETIT